MAARAGRSDVDRLARRRGGVRRRGEIQRGIGNTQKGSDETVKVIGIIVVVGAPLGVLTVTVPFQVPVGRFVAVL